MKEVAAVADQRLRVLDIPLPNDEQRAALLTAGGYFQSIGRQVASGLLGCPPLNEDTTTLARHSILLLRSAELCTGLVELAEQEPQ